MEGRKRERQTDNWGLKNPAEIHWGSIVETNKKHLAFYFHCNPEIVYLLSVHKDTTMLFNTHSYCWTAFSLLQASLPWIGSNKRKFEINMCLKKGRMCSLSVPLETNLSKMTACQYSTYDNTAVWTFSEVWMSVHLRQGHQTQTQGKDLTQVHLDKAVILIKVTYRSMGEGYWQKHGKLIGR